MAIRQQNDLSDGGQTEPIRTAWLRPPPSLLAAGAAGGAAAGGPHAALSSSG